MPFYELTIEPVSSELVEELYEQLEQWDAVSVGCTDQGDTPLFEPLPGTTPLWPESIVTALFSCQQTARLAQEKLQQSMPEVSTSLVQVADKAWERVWMDDFHPMQFGKHLWICPSWTAPPVPDAVNILLDPGLAFGTGAHATTALCLRWLDAQPPRNQTVLDFGCGSGILSIAALKLGANTVFSVDIDPQAHEATQENAHKNNCEALGRLLIGQQDIIASPVDLIIANVLLDPLMHYKDPFMAWSKPQAKLVFSGLLKSQCDTLIDHYASSCDLISQQTDEDWALVVMQKRN